jgi:hypothetical protein
MTKPREVETPRAEGRTCVELWPCGYDARCSAPECRRRATTILRYLDNQGRPHPQTDLRHPRERVSALS